MAQNKRKLTADADLVVSTIPGKLRSVKIGEAGDNIYVLHNGADDGDPVIYQVDCAVEVPHDDLDIPFSELFCDKLSGTGGEINIIFE